MKRAGKIVAKSQAVALALTWDGARWPIRTLPLKAQTFLTDPSRERVLPAASQLAKLFAQDAVDEIRICWVPRLKGGGDVLAEPFPTSSGKRIGFKAAKTIRFGDVLGVIYRR